MSVSPISTSGYQPIEHHSMRQDLQSLQKGLKAGDLEGAQQAFVAFKEDFHATHGGKGLAQSGVPDAIQADLRGLQSSLRADDLDGAQQTFPIFKQHITEYMQHKDPVTVEPPQTAGGGVGVDVVG